jgi:hypothetical protein
MTSPARDRVERHTAGPQDRRPFELTPPGQGARLGQERDDATSKARGGSRAGDHEQVARSRRHGRRSGHARMDVSTTHPRPHDVGELPPTATHVAASGQAADEESTSGPGGHSAREAASDSHALPDGFAEIGAGADVAQAQRSPSARQRQAKSSRRAPFEGRNCAWYPKRVKAPRAPRGYPPVGIQGYSSGLVGDTLTLIRFDGNPPSGAIPSPRLACVHAPMSGL